MVFAESSAPSFQDGETRAILASTWGWGVWIPTAGGYGLERSKTNTKPTKQKDTTNKIDVERGIRLVEVSGAKAGKPAVVSTGTRKLCQKAESVYPWVSCASSI